MQAFSSVSLLVLITAMAANSDAFTVLPPAHGVSRPTTTAIAAEVPDKEEGMDLNLEEMFTMFDAADKDEEFDDAIKKVKTAEED